MSEGASDAVVRATLQEVVFDPKKFGEVTTAVKGNVRLVDLDVGRMDIASGGAKLIVRLDSVQSEYAAHVERLAPSLRVRVLGKVKKSQRRTFLDATAIEIMDDGSA